VSVKVWGARQDDPVEAWGGASVTVGREGGLVLLDAAGPAEGRRWTLDSVVVEDLAYTVIPLRLEPAAAVRVATLLLLAAGEARSEGRS
jgi:hypothetical protein